MVNEYGALLDMHQDETKSEIEDFKSKLIDIDEKIARLNIKKKRISETIENKIYCHDLYEKMIELIGR